MQKAATIIRDAGDLDRLLERMVKGDESEISYGVAPLPAKALLPPILLEAITNNSGLRSNVAIRSVANLLPMLLDEEIEFFVCAAGQIPSSAPLKHRRLGRAPFSLIVRSGHPLLINNTTECNKEYPILTGAPLESTASFPEYIKRHLAGAPHLVVNDYVLMAHLTENSDVLMLSSALAMEKEIREGRLAEVVPQGGEQRAYFDLMLYTLERRTLSPAAIKVVDQFVELIQKSSFD